MTGEVATSEADGYPPSAFYFKVMFASTMDNEDTSFQEVSGMSSQLEVEEVQEGGQNRFVHKLPKGVKNANLELKRGTASVDSPLVQWCQSVFEMDFISPITPQSVCVYLMNAEQVPLRAWIFENAYPVKWEVEPFNSTKNDVTIEKIVLSYTYSTRML
jgi:phage tail-like protein